MKRIEKTYDIFLISPNEYITIKKLNSLGIFKEDIEKYKTQITELKETITSINMASLMKRIKEAEGKDVIIYLAKNLDEIQKRALINEGVLTFNGIIMVMDDVDGPASYVAGKKEGSGGLSLKEFKEKLMSDFGAKGVGSDIMIQGRIPLDKEVKEKLMADYM